VHTRARRRRHARHERVHAREPRPVGHETDYRTHWIAYRLTNDHSITELRMINDQSIIESPMINDQSITESPMVNDQSITESPLIQ
jgi:hypothetical protein